MEGQKVESPRISSNPPSNSSSQPGSPSHVHRLVQDENAKTILLNVPLEISVPAPAGSNEPPLSLKPPKRPAAASAGHSPKEAPTRPQRKQLREGSSTSLKRAALGKKTPRARSASVGRSKESGLQARYWAFLFENLRRAVDDLYITCESDDSVPAAKEVVLVLENYVRDFKNLVDWLRLKWEYENTPPLQRPTSLAWEVRKTSPAGAKLTPTTAFATQRLLLATPAKRALNFDLDQKEPLQTHTEAAKEVDTTPVDEKENEEPVEEVKKPEKVEKENSKVRKQNSLPIKSKLESLKEKDVKATSRPTSVSRLASSRSVSTSNLARTASNPKLVKATKTSDDLANKSHESTTKPVQAPKQRVSLVARQSLAAAASNQNRASSKANSTLVGSVKTDSRPVSARSAAAAKVQSRSTGVRPVSASATSSIQQHSKTVPPFGSTSSISSSGSSRSWADTVRGLSAPRSVENLQAFNSLDEDPESNEGWETVRPRTRSKISPSNKERLIRRGVLKSSQSGNKPPLTKRESLDSSIKVKHSIKTRYQLPSSAISLPTLALMKEEDGEAQERPSSSKPGYKTAIKVDKAKQGSPSRRESQSTKEVIKSKPKPLSCEDKTGVKTLPKSRVSSSRLTKTASVRNTKVDDKATEDTTESAIVENDLAIKKAQEEEDKLAAEIRETENEQLSDDAGSNEPKESSHSLQEERRSETPKFPQGLSWAEEIDLEEQLYESRYPGRAIQLHEKLSSPARKREPHEAFKMHQEKQNQARLRREKFQDEKATKLSALNSKIEEVIAHKEMLIEIQRTLLDDKMKKAEEKRQQHIEGIRRKAHEEDAKLKEIAFINNLQAQNSRIDMLAHSQTMGEKHEERLAELAEERARKVEERASKEARAEQKRRKLEEKRQKDMEALKERIRTREERIQEEQEQARKDRVEAAREKARDREEKLISVRTAEKDLKNELQEKIQQKQEDAAKRHKEKLEKIRNKAFELSVQRCSKDEGVPNLQAYEPKKKCDICNVLISNEVHLQSHLSGKRHCEKVIEVNNGRKLSGEEIQSCNLQYIVDAAKDEMDAKSMRAKERSKNMKKKVKKIKNRMMQRAAEFEQKLVLPSKFDSPNRGKIGKALKDIEKTIGSQGKGAWPKNAITSLERHMGEIYRALEKSNPDDRNSFYALNGFTILAKIFHLLLEQKTSCVIPLKSVVTCSRLWTLACQGHNGNTEFVIKYNHLTYIIDILTDRLQILNKLEEDSECSLPKGGPQLDPVAKAIMALLAQCFEDLAIILKDIGISVDQSKPEDLTVRVQDQISYIVNIGIIDLLAGYLNGVQDPIDSEPEVGDFLLTSLNFMSALANASEVLTKPPGDPTNLLLAYQVTDLAGIVSMLYGILLHQGAPSRCHEGPPPTIPDYTIAVVTAASKLLHHLVRQHLVMMQEVLGQEGISLEFRHIASYLIWYCQHHNHPDLLNLTIILVGYFAAKHGDNQSIIQSGHQPSVLQQLCSLPFQYFSKPSLKAVLFPTLIAVCDDNPQNHDIMAQEVSYQLLKDFMASPQGKSNHLVQLVLAKN